MKSLVQPDFTTMELSILVNLVVLTVQVVRKSLQNVKPVQQTILLIPQIQSNAYFNVSSRLALLEIKHYALKKRTTLHK